MLFISTCAIAQRVKMANEPISFLRTFQATKEVTTFKKQCDTCSPEVIETNVSYYVHEFKDLEGPFICLSDDKNPNLQYFGVERIYSKLSDNSILFFSYGKTTKIYLK